MRHNPDLDGVFNGPTDDVNSTILPKPKRRRRTKAMSRDVAKRHAFRVLNLLAGLDARERDRVLRLAAKISKS